MPSAIDSASISAANASGNRTVSDFTPILYYRSATPARHASGRGSWAIEPGYLPVPGACVSACRGPKEDFLRTIVLTIALLTISNLFMTVAWYAHLKNLSSKPWYVAALISWGIAFFEYMVQVPANRIGFGRLSLAQLKVIQEVVTLSVFVPFAVLYMKQTLNLNFLWAGICLIGAVFFMFR